MKKHFKATMLTLLSLATSVCVFLGTGMYAHAEDELVSGCGFTSNNASGTISKIADATRLSAKAATTGDIFDYTYDTPVNVADTDVFYTLTTDTTRGNGAHSRMDIYVLPEKNSDLSDGVKIEILHSVYDDDETKFIVTGPDNGSCWNSPAYFTDDYSTEMRIFADGNDMFAAFNGARYQFTEQGDKDKLAAMKTAGKAYLRFSAHYQESGEAALGYDLDIRSIDGVSLGNATVKNTTALSSKISANTEAKAEMTEGALVMSGKFTAGALSAFKYTLGSEHRIESGKLSGFGMTFDISGVDLSVKKYIEVSVTNILDNVDRMDAWDSLGDAAGQPTIFAATYRLYLTPGEVVTAVMKSADGDQGTFDIAGGANVLDNAPYYKFSSYIPRADKAMTFSVGKVKGDWKVFVNGASVGFEKDIDSLMNKLEGFALDVSVNLGSDDAANYYATAGEVPVDVLKITGVNGKTIDLEPDPYEGDYADEIDGETEFIRTQYVNIAPDSATYHYAVTNEGISIFGRNDALGFGAGLGFTEALTLDRETQLTFTVKMPETVYASGAEKHGYYCLFLGDSTHKNFSEMRSIYLRISYESSDVTVKSATSPFKVEVILWDNTTEQLVVSSATDTFAPKTTKGRESEITFRFVFDGKEGVYKLYINGKKATSAALETALTNYIDNVMEKLYFASSFDYAMNNEAKGAWTEEYTDMIGLTLIGFNGKRIVNKVPDMFASMTLKDGKDITATSATLSWTKGEYAEGDFDSYNFTPTGYKLVRNVAVKDGEETKVVEDKTVYIDDIDTVEYTDTGLKPETAYYYSVYAVQKNEDGTYTELFRSNLNKRVMTLSDKAPETSEEDSVVTSAGGKNGCLSGIGSGSLLLAGLLLGAAGLLKKKKYE